MKKNINSPLPATRGKGEVRIIAGHWRGRKLPVLNAPGLRPTGDRIKETLFNWLMPHIRDCTCLDAFSGSGSLGFEALSRGAKQVTFLERDKATAKQLQANLERLNCPPTQARVIQRDSLAFLAQAPNQMLFDLVFLDPPFHFGLAQQSADLLASYQWLNPEAFIYVETEKEADFRAPQQWALLKQKSAGQVCCRLFQYGITETEKGE
ncbi:16S rRNA m(2)G-966 methyltransferase [Mesocricetibacter intestinalis]|uniref:Ribosomal RNA small subunit methyltransferase D n=1 Tax=Mesocricetibacter intestinalis TaxID=1521930 RepID=A0A4R6VHI2_9PAST|nr:16S rRNA (guanine(966)-N(2))-methyltransferase RsmD [Mesocricetibacter intestinalis]TDQ57688.1 16S rRNA m(2)G-966 methyltransferase [Mesocricetibacter intestinalis]